VGKAADILEVLSASLERDVRFNITVANAQGAGSGWPMKGIYIRDPPLDKAKEFTVSVDPVFLKEASVGKNAFCILS